MLQIDTNILAEIAQNTDTNEAQKLLIDLNEDINH